ncbi:UNVERIFIED_CONTAM: Protein DETOXIFICATION 35, partial [Sesamum indicum]
LGMASALETLCGQAFGAGKIEMLGTYMQRSMIILFASCVLLLPLYFFATPILKLLGQQDEIANLVGPYSLITIPQLFSLAVSFPTQKFLQAQSKVSVLVWITFLAMISQIFLCWLFIYIFRWGTTGAAVAFDITSWGVAIAQYIYVVCWCTDGWKGYSWSAFSEIWAFVRLSVASAIMQCLEIWYMTSIVILTGHLSNSVTAVGSLSICMNVNNWELMVFIGINAAISMNVDGLETMLFVGVNAAISVRVSNELGLGHPRAAKYSVYVTIFQSLLIGILCMAVILTTREYFAIIFTDSENMQRAVAHLSSLLGVTMLLNSIQPVISGVAIGGGWQALVAYINLGCYYIFGLPLGYVLGYVADFGVMGIWGGMIAGLALQTLLLFIVLYKTNWNKEGVWGGMIAGVALQTLLLFLVLYKTNWNKEVEQMTARMRKWGGQDTVISIKNTDVKNID